MPAIDQPPAAESGEITMVEADALPLDAPAVVVRRDSGGLREADMRRAFAELAGEQASRPIIDKRLGAILTGVITILAGGGLGGSYLAQGAATEAGIRQVVQEEIAAAMEEVQRGVEQDKDAFSDKVSEIERGTGVTAAKTTAIEAKVTRIETSVVEMQKDVAVLKDRSERP